MSRDRVYSNLPIYFPQTIKHQHKDTANKFNHQMYLYNMKKLFFIIGAALLLSSCEHTINNYECKCDGTCCQSKDSTTVVDEGLIVPEEQTEEVVMEGEQ